MARLRPGPRVLATARPSRHSSSPGSSPLFRSTSSGASGIRLSILPFDRLALPSSLSGRWRIALPWPRGWTHPVGDDWRGLAWRWRCSPGSSSPVPEPASVLLAAPAVMAIVAFVDRGNRPFRQAVLPILGQGLAVVLVYGISLCGPTWTWTWRGWQSTRDTELIGCPRRDEPAIRWNGVAASLSSADGCDEPAGEPVRGPW